MPNRLAEETSPYLLQHAHNPVDWYPWCEEAFARAAAEDRPVLLSVGYSACHWCHVMERESFEDEAIAARLNADFVCVKVDREERPDVDSVYMQAVQAFSGGRGGWPMTLFLTPDGRPFFGGTYYPPVPRAGMPGFLQVLDHVLRLWREQRERVDEVAGSLAEHLGSQEKLPAGGALQPGWLEALARAADEAYDEEVPGLGPAPRFPRPWTVAALLAHWRRTGWRRSLGMAEGLLDAMAAGGMYDFVGGGFARYSVDRQWLIPHFEKMLYDNAQLAPVYADAWLATGHARHARIARETLDFVLRELKHPRGGFTSALDADSEGEEGLYYTWTPALLAEALGEADGARAAALLGVSPGGNFEHGRSVLRPPAPLEQLDAEDRAFLERIRPALLAAREQRVRPGLDGKVITGWNGLLISALARCGAALAEPRYTRAAAGAARFLLEVASAGSGPERRLHRSWKDERLGAPAFLDDYAFLILGLLDLYEASSELEWLEQALGAAERMVALFWDETDGGFYYTGSDAEALVARQKPLVGGAVPGGNEAAALALVRLETLCGRTDLGDKAERVLAGLQPLLDRAPMALGPALLAADWRAGPVQEIGIVAADDDAVGAAMLAEVRRRYQPFRVLARVPPGPAPAVLPWLEGRTGAGPATAFVCVGRACLLPAQDTAALAAQLDELDAPVQPPPAGGGLLRVRVHAPALPTEPERWLNTERPLSLEALAGSVVVLDFWTYCCINCLHVLPELAAVEQRFAGQPVAVVGVHSAKFMAEEQRESVARALDRHRVRHPVVLDPEHELWRRYAVKSWPTVLVLDPTGRVAFKRSGEIDRHTLSRVIEELLEEGRAAGTLGEPAWHLPAPAPGRRGLSHPGKVHTSPAELAQARGADPLDGGRLYIADTGRHRILAAALSRGEDGWPAATLTACWGGEAGLVDGAADQARFRDPQGLFEAEGVLWVADTGNHALRRIDLGSGAVTTAAGTGELGRGHGGDPTRPRSVALRSPWDVAAAEGAVFIAMAGSHQLWIYLSDRDQLGPFAGSGREDHVDGALEEAALAQPSGLSLLGSTLFFADSEVSSIRAVDLRKREVLTVVGRGLFDFGDVDGAPEEVLLQHPLGVAAAPDALYVADTFNGKIKRIDTQSRRTTTLAEGLSEPGGLALAGEFLVVADTGAHRLVAIHRRSGASRPLSLQGLDS